MPHFDYEGDIYVDVDDFISVCNSNEIKELIQALVDDGYLPNSVLNNTPVGTSISEFEFENALDKLHGKWCVLTKEEEDIIIKISKRF